MGMALETLRKKGELGITNYREEEKKYSINEEFFSRMMRSELSIERTNIYLTL